MTAAAPPTLSYIGYETFLADVEILAGAVRAGGWSPDFLVGVGRGGLVPAAYLSHRTGIALLSIDHSSRVSDFADELLVKLAAKTAGGERILFVDDINDSGSTIAYLRDAILAAGGVAEKLRFAVLVNNSRSQARVDYWARAIDRTVDKDWLVFPWEAVSDPATITADAGAVPGRLA